MLSEIKNLSPMEKRFESLGKKIALSLELELYDVEYKETNHLLRMFIMSPKTSSAQLDDCVSFDRALTPWLENEEWVPETLTLEVSSPGLERNLRTKKHFEQILGKDVMVSTKKPLGEIFPEVPASMFKNSKFKALVHEVHEESIDIEVKGIVLSLNLGLIKKANLMFSSAA